MQNVQIKKFGGTSVGSIERIRAVADRIVEDRNTGLSPVVVVSAMSGQTDWLMSLAQKFGTQNRGVAYDMLLAVGEQISVALLAMALEQKKVKATPLLAHQVGIQTDSFFSKARIKKIHTDQILQCLKEDQVPLVAGFQGVTAQNKITTLGRGGSDTTAVALALALGKSSCEIFTDVPKVYSADPHLLKMAQPIDQLSFEEMMEMSSLGSRVLHYRCVELAAKYKIRLHVRSTFEKTNGTWIVPKEELMETPLVSAVTYDSEVVVIKMSSLPSGTAFINRLFNELAKKLISIDVISQSDQETTQRLAFSVSSDDLHDTQKIVYQIVDKEKVLIVENVAKLSIVGVGMASHPGVAARFFKVLHQENLRLHLVTTSEIKISAIIDKSYLLAGASALHKEFKLEVGGEKLPDKKIPNKKVK